MINAANGANCVLIRSSVLPNSTVMEGPPHSLSQINFWEDDAMTLYSERIHRQHRLISLINGAIWPQSE